MNRGLRVARQRLAVLNDRVAAQAEARDRLEAALRKAEERPIDREGESGA